MVPRNTIQRIDVNVKNAYWVDLFLYCGTKTNLRGGVSIHNSEPVAIHICFLKDRLLFMITQESVKSTFKGWLFAIINQAQKTLKNLLDQLALGFILV